MKKRFVGIDYGKARIGLSISDESYLLASPYKTIKAGKTVEESAKIIIDSIKECEEEKKFTVEKCIIGLPLMLSGKEGDQAKEVLQFAQLIQEKGLFEIQTWDERLTTLQAEGVMKMAGVSRKKRQKSIDQMAAVIILQSFLDTL